MFVKLMIWESEEDVRNRNRMKRERGEKIEWKGREREREIGMGKERKGSEREREMISEGKWVLRVEEEVVEFHRRLPAHQYSRVGPSPQKSIMRRIINFSVLFD